MRILLIHNKYLNYGGEDAVVDNEFRLLGERGMVVKRIFFDNVAINPSKLFYNKDSYKIIDNAIQEFLPDVIHIHNIFYQASPSILYAAKKRNIPVVMTLHNFRLLCPKGLFLRNSKLCLKCKSLKFPYHAIIYKCFQESYMKTIALSSFLGVNNTLNTWNKKIDRFIVLTPFIKKVFLESSLKVDKEKIIVKPNSTDDFISEKGLVKQRKNFLFVGRLSTEKGIHLLIEAFNQMPKITLEVIGEGDLMPILSKMAKSNIVFHGKKDRSFIKDKLEQAKALILPSIWYEGLPNTIIEAFSAGTPVLASDIDNINNIIEDNYNGKLFDVKNIKSIVQTVIDFNDSNTSQFNEKARETFQKKYSHEVNYKNLKKIYTELVESNEKRNN